MSRSSTSSDASSALSDATTVCSYTKESPAVDAASIATTAAADSENQRRGLRQRARDLVADMGNPPTKRHDAKHGKVTKSYADISMLGAAIMGGTSGKI